MYISPAAHPLQHLSCLHPDKVAPGVDIVFMRVRVIMSQQLTGI